MGLPLEAVSSLDDTLCSCVDHVGLLACDQQDGSKLFSAGADKAARMYDLQTGQAQQVRAILRRAPLAREHPLTNA